MDPVLLPGDPSLRSRDPDGVGGPQTPTRAPVRGGGPAYPFPGGGGARPRPRSNSFPCPGLRGHTPCHYASGFSCGFHAGSRVRTLRGQRRSADTFRSRESLCPVAATPGPLLVGSTGTGSPECSPTLPDCSTSRSCVQGCQPTWPLQGPCAPRP